MPSGTIKFFSVTKGFGFITPDEGARDMFVHVSAAPPSVILQEGQRITYDVGIDRKSGRERACSTKRSLRQQALGGELDLAFDRRRSSREAR